MPSTQHHRRSPRAIALPLLALVVLCAAPSASRVASAPAHDPAAAPVHDERPQKREMRMMTFDADNAVMIDETGMVVTAKDGKLLVEMVAPPDRRPKENADLDIAIGDEVGMAAGKKMTTIKDLRAAYEGTKPGEEFRLGLRRDGSSFIVSFTKMDRKDLPGRRMVIRTEDGPGAGPGTRPGGGPGGDDVERDILPALGIALELRKDRVIVTDVFPNGPKEMAAGDVISSINGKPVKHLDDFNAVYDKAPEGAELSFGLLRDGKKVSVTVKRTRPDVEVKVK